MPAAPLPPDEDLRLRTLLEMGLLDTPRKNIFDTLVEEANKCMGTPIAAISLVDERRQWFKARAGLSLELVETSRDVSFCAYSILTPGRTMHVPDASQDRRFVDNAFVQGRAKIRSYSGVPILAPNGAPIGVFCVLDIRPRARPPEDLDRLRNIARVATRFLNLEASVRHISHH